LNFLNKKTILPIILVISVAIGVPTAFAGSTFPITLEAAPGGSGVLLTWMYTETFGELDVERATDDLFSDGAIVGTVDEMDEIFDDDISIAGTYYYRLLTPELVPQSADDFFVSYFIQKAFAGEGGSEQVSNTAMVVLSFGPDPPVITTSSPLIALNATPTIEGTDDGTADEIILTSDIDGDFAIAEFSSSWTLIPSSYTMTLSSATTHTITATATNTGGTSGPSNSITVQTPVSLWTGDDFLASVSDVVGNNDGEFFGCDTTGTPLNDTDDIAACTATGIVGDAFSFNNTIGGQGISVPDAANLNLNALTISAWIKVEAEPETGEDSGVNDNRIGTIFDKFSQNATTDEYTMYVRDPTDAPTGASGDTFVNLGGAIGNGIDSDGLLSVDGVLLGGTIPLNVWTHVAMTHDDAAIGINNYLYINGVQVTADDTPPLAGSALVPRERGVTNGGAIPNDFPGLTHDIAIGHASINPATGIDRTFPGLIDELTLYNTALSQSQIATLVADVGAPSAPTIDLDAGSDSGDSNSDDLTKLTVLTLTGTSDVGTSIEVFDDMTLGSLGTTTVDTNGDWQFVTGTLTEGDYDFRAEATHGGGTTTSATLPVEIDLTAPSTPLAPDLQAGSDSGSSGTDEITMERKPAFDVASESGNALEVFVDGATQPKTSIGIVLSSSTVSIAPTTDLIDDVYDVTATSTDLAGNPSGESSALSVTIDNVAPSTPAPPDLQAGSDSGSSGADEITMERKPAFDVDTEDQATVEVFVDGDTQAKVSIGTDVAESTATVAPTSDLIDDVYDVTATSTDLAGNPSGESLALSVTIENVAPSIDGAGAGALSGFFGVGDNIPVTLVWSEDVIVELRDLELLAMVK